MPARVLPFAGSQSALDPDETPEKSQFSFTADPYGRSTDLDPVWQRVTGLTVDQCRAGVWLDVVHPDDAELLSRRIHLAFASGRELTPTPARVRLVSGAYLTVEISMTPFLTPGGRISHWAGCVAYDARALRRALSKASRA
jgi:hypothetical protein